MVFHHTFDPDYVVPDCRRFVNRQDVLIADILFHETKDGLLRCLHNDEALKKVTDRLIELGAEYPPLQLPQDTDRRRVWLSFFGVVGTILFVVVILGILKATRVI